MFINRDHWPYIELLLTSRRVAQHTIATGLAVSKSWKVISAKFAHERQMKTLDCKCWLVTHFFFSEKAQRALSEPEGLQEDLTAHLNRLLFFCKTISHRKSTPLIVLTPKDTQFIQLGVALIHQLPYPVVSCSQSSYWARFLFSRN